MAAIFTGLEWLLTNDLVIPGYPFTLATWFRCPSAQPSAALLSWEAFPAAQYHAITLSADGLHLQAESRSGPAFGEFAAATSGMAFTPNVWTHAAATFNAADERH